MKVSNCVYPSYFSGANTNFEVKKFFFHFSFLLAMLIPTVSRLTISNLQITKPTYLV